MTDEWADLRQLAEAVGEAESWLRTMEADYGTDSGEWDGAALRRDALTDEWHAAASPEKVLRLLAERDRLAEDVAALRAALSELLDAYDNWQPTDGSGLDRADQAFADARALLARSEAEAGR